MGDKSKMIGCVPAHIPESERERDRLGKGSDPFQAELEALLDEYENNDVSEVPVSVISSNDEALKALSSIAEQFRSGVAYDSLRRKFMAASFAANEFRLTAPIFRDQPKLSGKKSEWSRQTQLLLDLIVIDCHWLYCRAEQVDAKWPEVQRALDLSRPFSGEEVMERIARKKWSAGFRCGDLLTLTLRQQLQLVQLREDVVKKQMRLLIDGGVETLGLDLSGKPRKVRVPALFIPVKRKIREWAEERSSVKPSIRMHESLWLARELLGPKAPLKHIAELAALRCGCPPLSPKTVDDKLKALDRRLAEFP